MFFYTFSQPKILKTLRNYGKKKFKHYQCFSSKFSASFLWKHPKHTLGGFRIFSRFFGPNYTDKMQKKLTVISRHFGSKYGRNTLEKRLKISKRFLGYLLHSYKVFLPKKLGSFSGSFSDIIGEKMVKMFNPSYRIFSSSCDEKRLRSS